MRPWVRIHCKYYDMDHFWLSNPCIAAVLGGKCISQVKGGKHQSAAPEMCQCLGEGTFVLLLERPVLGGAISWCSRMLLDPASTWGKLFVTWFGSRSSSCPGAVLVLSWSLLLVCCWSSHDPLVYRGLCPGLLVFSWWPLGGLLLSCPCRPGRPGRSARRVLHCLQISAGITFVRKFDERHGGCRKNLSDLSRRLP